jgi:membrane protease YdiL (CAAX protease family)
MSDTSKFEISILNALLLTMAYFVICLLVPTAINISIWRKLFGNAATGINIATLIITSFIFFFTYYQRTQYKIDFFWNITLINILLAVVCSIVFFLLLDKCLDPFFDKMFQSSAAEYQETLSTLRQSPITTFIRICLFAPIAEEILMRGYILNGLKNKYGAAVAVIISALLFAVLHFNFVQTLSAVICGLVLGLLYSKTNSISCCILAHALYNAISFFTIVIG